MPVKHSSFAEIVERGEQMLASLAGLGVSVKPGSTLLRYVASARESQRCFETQADISEPVASALVRDLANLSMLSKCLVKASPTFLARARKHLRALGEGEPGPVTRGANSQARSLVFELLCAAACDRFALDTRLDEPDVTCLFENALWGLACKTVSGNPESGVSAIRKGISQLEASPCKYGLVILQITDLFPHHEMRRHHNSETELTERLKALVVETARPIAELVQTRFNEYKNWPGPQVRGVLFLVHTIGYLGTAAILGTGELRAFHPPRRIDLEDRFGTELQRAFEALY